MAVTKAAQESTSFNPSVLIELFELDGRALGSPGPHLFFAPMTNNNVRPIIFNGQSYQPYPLSLTGMQYDGKGLLPRPQLQISNIAGFISTLLRATGNLTFAKFIRRRVWGRFIDGANFPGGINPYGTPDATAAYPDEVFYVNRKTSENKQTVEIELVTALEIDNAKLPHRQILAQICPFKYRDPETCGYSGAPIADSNDKVFGAGGYGFTLVDQSSWNNSTVYNQGDYVSTTSTFPLSEGQVIVFVCAVDGTVGDSNNPSFNPKNWISDACSRRQVGCRYRFPSPQTLRFGGYPGVTRAPVNL